MAFDGHLLYIGEGTSYPFPHKYIQYDTYDATPNQRQDVDSFRDLYFDLHRSVADHYKGIVKFQTRPLWENDLRYLMDTVIHNHYENVKERKLKLRYFSPEDGNYYSGSFYLVQPQFRIRKIEDSNVQYDSVTFEFIQY